MNYTDVLNNAREIFAKKCRVCKECNGIACKGEVPGVGGKGTGAGFIRNREKINEVKIHLDTIVPTKEIDTSIGLFGKTLKFPILAAPIGGLDMNYNDYLNDLTYSQAIIEGCINAGVLGCTGDGVKDEYYDVPLGVIGDNEGMGIPTIKPWKNEEIIKKIKKAEEKGAPAVAIDIDAAGLVVLAMLGKPVATKSVEELKEITSSTKLPVILKGIMTTGGVVKALESGAHGIVVSNHGGRVLDHTLSTIEVLPEIVKAAGGKLKIFIDGGFRDGIDVFKALAMGADAVLIGRPYAIAAYGGGREGVEIYTQKVGQELKETMIMAGCHQLQDIGKQHVSHSF
ncbi:FMN-dependent dehydrogenase, includes L-lactate dehydrogenase and type II isopentenyl diphosphate isomerase [Anaerovirgula multivorans]|uniref:L-lactate oxidase n=1 Tax=Anaerovirgula multivorans TaxID=312168 RepID=A0A239B994_9FIRM|nr:alpha-hydroxy-acid oxidizing protein [Anaerovirgula multivorans]SNS03673.1 FMN-dependent dehydrogenase, includes L-lactate dehydrogenase and type II isopentenyl diphosphate isomerase [Anaerovirgula multivorans]